jgi:hypothetical protein
VLAVKIPVVPWKGDSKVPVPEAAILIQSTRYFGDEEGYALVELRDGLKVLARGWSFGRPVGDPFVSLTLHGVPEGDFLRAVELLPIDAILQGSGAPIMEDDVQVGIAWAAGEPLILAVTSIELAYI